MNHSQLFKQPKMIEDIKIFYQLLIQSSENIFYTKTISICLDHRIFISTERVFLEWMTSPFTLKLELVSGILQGVEK